MPQNPVRRVSATSRRFHAAPRSRPVTWLIGGIGGCFALALAFVLLGGSPPVDTLPETVAALEAKARKAESDGRLDEAILQFNELIRMTERREDYRIPAIEWRRVIKDLQAEIAGLREVDAEFAALEQEGKACGSGEARAVWEKLQRFRVKVERLKRPWKKDLDALVERVAAKIPRPPPSWQVRSREIAEEFGLEKRGAAVWGGAVRAWQAYLKLELGAADRLGAEAAMRAVELRAREEVASMKGRKVSFDELRKQRPRFEGTQVVADLDRAIEGR